MIQSLYSRSDFFNSRYGFSWKPGMMKSRARAHGTLPQGGSHQADPFFFVFRPGDSMVGSCLIVSVLQRDSSRF